MRDSSISLLKFSQNYFTCFTKPFLYLSLWKDKQKIYKKSRYLLNEYIDVKKIIQRLQDIDKLKNILLNNSQRFLFDRIPKPEIVDNLTINEKKSISLNPLANQKKNMPEQSYLENYEDLCKGYSEIDERILTSLDEQMLKKLNNRKKKECGKIIIWLIIFYFSFFVF